eukprot:TRINITY_DN3149_c0_g1_i1.p2 TRINITY_DN3149_c0_g1~~TRINITY_DN3149_c0_g1_i1.p2  ORF type:complete len:410 (-),score=-1.71 TRINITY_DN3149_c0_g1_i1:1210-2439(-)
MDTSLSLLLEETNDTSNFSQQPTPLYQSPPDLEMCRNHLKACQPFIPTSDDRSVLVPCLCCNEKYVPLERVPNPEPIPISYSYDYAKLTDQLGHAAVLYFVQMKYFLFLCLSLVPLAMTTAIINISDNADPSNKLYSQINSATGLHFIADVVSLGNCTIQQLITITIVNADKLWWYSIINTCNILVLYLVWIQLCYAFNKKCRDKDKFYTTADKYAVELQNFPTSDEMPVETVLEQSAGSNFIRGKIAQITHAYLIPDYAELNVKINQLQCKIKNIEGLRQNYRVKHPNATSEEIANQYPFWFSFYRCTPSTLYNKEQQLHIHHQKNQKNIQQKLEKNSISSLILKLHKRLEQYMSLSRAQPIVMRFLRSTRIKRTSQNTEDQTQQVQMLRLKQRKLNGKTLDIPPWKH